MDNNEVEPRGTKRRVLREAERLFATQGYRGISMREIAAACGISKAGIYYHFKDKEDLYLQVLEMDVLALKEAIRQAAVQGATCRERITNIVTTYLELMRDKKNLIQLTIREIGGLEEGIRQLIARRRTEATGPIEAIIEEGIAKGELRPMNSRLAALSLLGMMSIFLTEYVFDIPLAVEGEVVPHTVQLFLEGATPR